MSDSKERAKISFSYRINQDGTHETRINHTGMPHKSEMEMGKCDICRFLTRRLDKLHVEVFHLTLNRGLFETPKPKAPEKPVTTEVRPEPTKAEKQQNCSFDYKPTTEQIYE